MRNTLVQSLPPGGQLIILVTPPMASDERYHLLTPPAFPPVVVRVVDDAHVSVTNPSVEPAYFIFTVIKKTVLPSGLYEGIAAFLAARKNT